MYIYLSSFFLLFSFLLITEDWVESFGIAVLYFDIIIIMAYNFNVNSILALSLKVKHKYFVCVGYIYINKGTKTEWFLWWWWWWWLYCWWWLLLSVLLNQSFSFVEREFTVGAVCCSVFGRINFNSYLLFAQILLCFVIFIWNI